MMLSWSTFIFVPRIFPQPTIWMMTSHSMISSSSIITPWLFSMSPASCLSCSSSILYTSRLPSSPQCFLPSRVLVTSIFRPKPSSVNLVSTPFAPSHFLLIFLSSASPMSSHSHLWSKKKNFFYDGSQYLKSSSLSFLIIFLFQVFHPVSIASVSRVFYLHIPGLPHSSNPNAPISIPSSSKPSALPRNRVFHTLSRASSSSASLCTIILGSADLGSLVATSPSHRCLQAILRLSSHPLQASQNNLSCRVMPSKPMSPGVSASSAAGILSEGSVCSSTSWWSGLSTRTRFALCSSKLVFPGSLTLPEPSAFLALSTAWAGTFGCQLDRQNLQVHSRNLSILFFATRPAFRVVVLRIVGSFLVSAFAFVPSVVAPIGFACVGGLTLVVVPCGPTLVLCLSSHPRPPASSSVPSLESVNSSTLFLFFLPPAPPVWQDTFLPKHSAHASKCRPPLVRGMHGRFLALQRPHFIFLGSASTTTSAFFGTPFFPPSLGLAFGVLAGVIVEPSLTSLSPSSSVVISSSLRLSSSPRFSFISSRIPGIGVSTGIMVGELACSTRPSRLGRTAYTAICWLGISACTGVISPCVWCTVLFFPAPSVMSITGAHAFLSSSSSAISSPLQSHAMAAARASNSSMFPCHLVSLACTLIILDSCVQRPVLSSWHQSHQGLLHSSSTCLSCCPIAF